MLLDGEIKYFYRCLILFPVLDKNSGLINTNDFFLQSLSALTLNLLPNSIFIPDPSLSSRYWDQCQAIVSRGHVRII